MIDLVRTVAHAHPTLFGLAVLGLTFLFVFACSVNEEGS